MKVQHSNSFFVEGDALIAMIGIHRLPSSSGALCHEIAPPHQVVGRRAEAKQPVDEASAPMPQFAEEGDGLQPAEGLLDQLSLALTQRVARMTRGAAVDGTAPIGRV